MDNSKRINMERIDILHRCFVQSPILQMCRQMVHNQLLNNGIKFSQGSKQAYKMKPEEEDDVENKWVPFCADVIDSVMVCGFAVVAINKCFPSVMKHGTYWMKIKISKNNEYEFSCYEKGAAEKEIQNVVVFNHFGYPPHNGVIDSLVEKVLPKLQFMKLIRQTCISMEMARSNPQYFSEIKDSGNGQQNREGIDFDFYADANAAETSDDMKFQRNRSAIEMLHQQKDLYESYLNTHHAKRASAALENVTQMPMGHIIKNGAFNTGRNDLVNIHKLLQEEVCAVFGVPRSMMFSDGPGNRSNDTVGSHASFMHTLLWWKKKLSVVLSECYNSINAENIMKDIKIKATDCVDDLKRKYKVNVYFPVTPFVSNDELRKLYEQGVISWKSYGEYALRNISLPIEDLQPKAPEIDELLFKKPPKEVMQPRTAVKPAVPSLKRKAGEPTKEPEKKKEKTENKSMVKKDDKK